MERRDVFSEGASFIISSVMVVGLGHYFRSNKVKSLDGFDAMRVPSFFWSCCVEFSLGTRCANEIGTSTLDRGTVVVVF
jgi:hypothetical protein